MNYGIYAQNTWVDNKSYSSSYSGKWTSDTKGLLIGPKVRYVFINKLLEFQGFYGYAVYVSQKVTFEAARDTERTEKAIFIFVIARQIVSWVP